MVFLRLTVKVFPRGHDGSLQNSHEPGTGKPVSFMLVLEHPEEITLGGLSSMIHAKWRKLRPNAE